MSANEKKLERCAKALCRIAGTFAGQGVGPCQFCSIKEPCVMWNTFIPEVIACLKAEKGFK
jgi:hypothetical protein